MKESSSNSNARGGAHYYDQRFLERDIEENLKQRRYGSRDDVIGCVRDFGNQRGFGICIPRGDIVL